MKCLDCGFENEEDSRFCERCGTRLEVEGQEKTKEEQIQEIDREIIKQTATEVEKAKKRILRILFSVFGFLLLILLFCNIIYRIWRWLMWHL
ncbi:zinc-ribbon domain-containing protein [bacterium]|nr:zinc-ribbon domain-containing protein [bacterium]